ncbi:unnamed protein product [Kuraishia capsulata CBS 1993]|uniref:Uncharacterized protein n=1 Tax=Kuraishia capsulata CBS 1993 TaxID=1382522 RepID=W6MV77_9ASCO|nr:uncharacterized protein KUCA_T00005805001 [Kuraishia capsulata CBS 1993]CDK29812.1 unnamed protein product [Kuraishia capsulata CBS 1993]
MSRYEELINCSDDVYDKSMEIVTASKAGKVYGDGLDFASLDHWRRVELPTILASRKDTHLTQDELSLLMEWKLAKGKFRPTLMKLIRSNDQAESATRAAFKAMMAYYDSSAQIWPEVDLEGFSSAVSKAADILCTLRGVGIATASLVLSLLSEVKSKNGTVVVPPFFSDEAFLYFAESAGKIKYTKSEYMKEYLPKAFEVGKLMDNPDLNAVESRAWAMFKSQATVKRSLEPTKQTKNTRNTKRQKKS